MAAFAANAPAGRVDVLGMYVGCCDGWPFSRFTHCCCDGKTIESRAQTDTGVSVCKGYLKGDWLWGWFPSHTFLKCGGKGFGLYARSHLTGGSSCGAIYDDGVIKDNDLVVYPELPHPAAGQPYSVCTPVKLSACQYDLKQFERCVCAFNQPGLNPGYMIGGWNCSTFANNAISYCKQQAKKTTCN